MYTPLDETMLQLGLYDYVWGDNTMLQNYLSRLSQEEQRQFQAEENAKNRQSQREYNEYLKEYDRNKALTEDYRADRVEYAKLQKERATADPRSKVVISAQMKNLEDKYKNTNYSKYFDSNNTVEIDKAVEAAAQRESQRSDLMLQLKDKIKNAKNAEEKRVILELARQHNEGVGNINEFSEKGFDKPLSEEDLAELAKYAESTETQEDAIKKNAQNNLINSINVSLEKKKAQKELADKAKAKLDKGYKLTKDEQDAYYAVYGGKK